MQLRIEVHETKRELERLRHENEQLRDRVRFKPKPSRCNQDTLLSNLNGTAERGSLDSAETTKVLLRTARSSTMLSSKHAIFFYCAGDVSHIATAGQAPLTRDFGPERLSLQDQCACGDIDAGTLGKHNASAASQHWLLLAHASDIDGSQRSQLMVTVKANVDSPCGYLLEFMQMVIRLQDQHYSPIACTYCGEHNQLQSYDIFLNPTALVGPKQIGTDQVKADLMIIIRTLNVGLPTAIEQKNALSFLFAEDTSDKVLLMEFYEKAREYRNYRRVTPQSDSLQSSSSSLPCDSFDSQQESNRSQVEIALVYSARVLLSQFADGHYPAEFLSMVEKSAVLRNFPACCMLSSKLASVLSSDRLPWLSLSKAAAKP